MSIIITILHENFDGYKGNIFFIFEVHSMLKSKNQCNLETNTLCFSESMLD
jgi:hypothetical protein